MGKYTTPDQILLWLKLQGFDTTLSCRLTEPEAEKFIAQQEAIVDSQIAGMCSGDSYTQRTIGILGRWVELSVCADVKLVRYFTETDANWPDLQKRWRELADNIWEESIVSGKAIDCAQPPDPASSSFNPAEAYSSVAPVPPPAGCIYR